MLVGLYWRPHIGIIELYQKTSYVYLHQHHWLSGLPSVGTFNCDIHIHEESSVIELDRMQHNHNKPHGRVFHWPIIIQYIGCGRIMSQGWSAFIQHVSIHFPCCTHCILYTQWTTLSCLISLTACSWFISVIWIESQISLVYLSYLNRISDISGLSQLSE